MEPYVVDFRSDTLTKPTDEMREAMAQAEVGDDVYREDPTVLRLEELVANMLGKEAALFVPSGTMGNLTSIMSHCWERGCEVIVGDESHINLYEQGGTAQLAGVFLKTVKSNPDGTFDLEELKSKLMTNPNQHCCKTKLICLENTNNRCGGAVLPVDFIDAVCQIGKDHGILIHMDAARLLNASVYLNIPAARLVKDCDSVSLCLSKGLGAPVGSVVAGSKAFIERVLRCRKVLGGAMRQVGVLAAAGIVALQSATKTLATDHSNAQYFAQEIAKLNSKLISVDLKKVQTNIVILKLESPELTAEQFVSKMQQPLQKPNQNVVVKTMQWSPVMVRCVLHSNITTSDVTIALNKIKSIC